MRTVLLLAIVALLTSGTGRPASAADATAGKPPSTPPAAAPAMKKFDAAVAAADAERARAVEKARAQLVTELKLAQKAAIQANDVDGATAVASLAKQYAEGGPAKALVGTVWSRKDRPSVRLNANGTFECSDPKYGGTWMAAGERTVIIVFNHGFLDVWRFNPDGKTFRASGYKSESDYDGAAAR